LAPHRIISYGLVVVRAFAVALLALLACTDSSLDRPEGSRCVRTVQCGSGLGCVEGRCAVVDRPIGHRPEWPFDADDDASDAGDAEVAPVDAAPSPRG
jgi:hypothetical protein